MNPHRPHRLKAFLTRSWLLQAAVVLVAAVAVGLVLSGALTSADDGDAGFSTMDVTQENLDVTIEGLCKADQLVEQGDLLGARNAFLDDAHAFLHVLAAEVLESDRDNGAQLLQAKYDVESLLLVSANGAPLAGTPAGIDAETDNPVTALIERVQQAAIAIDLNPTECEEGTR